MGFYTICGNHQYNLCNHIYGWVLKWDMLMLYDIWERCSQIYLSHRSKFVWSFLPKIKEKEITEE